MRTLVRVLFLLLAVHASSAAAETVPLRMPAGPRPVDGWPVILGNTMRHTPAVADVDGDGMDEIAVGTRDGYVFVLAGDGKPLSGWPRETGSWVYRSPLLEDIDGDGIFEVAAITFDGLLYMWRIDGSPVPGWPVDLGDTPSSSPLLVRAGPGGEGLILVSLGAGEIHLLTAKGAGYPGWPKTISESTLHTVTDTRPTAAADLDGDGSPEILHFSSMDPVLHVWRLDGSDYPGFPRAMGDRNGLGITLDSPTSPGLIACTTDRELLVLDVWGRTLYTMSPLDSGDRFATSPYFVSTGDAPQRHADHLLTATEDGAVHLWDREGRLVPGWPIRLSGFIYGLEPHKTARVVHGPPVVADADGDGELEIILGCYDHHVYCFEFDGSLVPGWPVMVEDAVSGTIALAELDGDGEMELVVGQIGETMFAYHLGAPPPARIDAGRPGSKACASAEWPPAYFAPAAAIGLMILLLAYQLNRERRRDVRFGAEGRTRAAACVLFALLAVRIVFSVANIRRYEHERSRLAAAEPIVERLLAGERRNVQRIADELAARLDSFSMAELRSPLSLLGHLERLADHYRFDYRLKGLLVTDGAGGAVLGVGLARGFTSLDELGMDDGGASEPVLIEETPVFVEESARGIGAGPDSLRFFLLSSLLGPFPDAIADATGFSAYLRLEGRTLAWGGAALASSPGARPRLDRTQPSRNITLACAAGRPRLSIHLAMEDFDRASCDWINVLIAMLLPALYLYLSAGRAGFERVRLGWWWIPLFAAAYIAGLVALRGGAMEAKPVPLAGRSLEVSLHTAGLLGLVMAARNVAGSRRRSRLDITLLGSYLLVGLIPLAAILIAVTGLVRDVQYRVVRDSIAELVDRADNLATSYVGRFDFAARLDAAGRRLLDRPPEIGWFNFVAENHFLFTYDLPAAFITLRAHDRKDPSRYFTGYSYRATRTDKFYSKRPAWAGDENVKGLFLDNGEPVIRALRTFRTRGIEAQMAGHIPLDRAILESIERRLHALPFLPYVRLESAWPESARARHRGPRWYIPFNTDIILHARDWGTGRPRWIAFRASAYLPPGRERWAIILPMSLLIILPLGLSFWGAYSTYQRTVQPLRRLLVGIRRVETGDMEYRLKDTGRSEVATAARAFDRMAESLKTNIRELAEKKKVEEVSELKSHFISMVSHDLKTPLASIQGAAENILEELAGPVSERQRTYLEMILRSSNNLQHMISNLLDLSRIESGHMTLDIETLDMKREAEHVLRFIQPLLDEKEIETRIAVEASHTAIGADRTRLWQILNNIVSNAVRFSPRGGRIDIRIADGIAPGADERPMLITTIVDQGPGITEDEEPRLFEPFFTWPSEAASARRAGLGLAIVKQLVELHGGSVSMRRSEEGGASFTFTMPAQKAL